MNKTFSLTCNNCLVSNSGFSELRMENLTRTMNDTVSKVVENVLENEINPSIEKSINESLKIQLEFIKNQLQQHDELLANMKSSICELQNRVETLPSGLPSENSLSTGINNLDTLAMELEVRQRKSSNIILYDCDANLHR